MEAKKFPCPVCSCLVYEHQACPNCHFLNSGQGIDAAYPASYHMDQPYPLREARFDYLTGGIQAVRDTIQEREREWTPTFIKNNLLPCPVCLTLVESYVSCPHCFFWNDGEGFDRDYPDTPNGDNDYSLNEAKAWYAQGGAHLTRTMICQREGWDPPLPEEDLPTCPVCGVWQREDGPCPNCAYGLGLPDPHNPASPPPPYILGQAQAWHRQGGATLTRKIIQALFSKN